MIMSERDGERHSDEEYLDAVRKLEPAGTSDIADAVGVVRQSADYRLRKLEDEGAVTSTKIGNSLAWRLADETATARPINPDDAFWEAESYEGELMSVSDTIEDIPPADAIDINGIRTVLEQADIEYAIVFGSHTSGRASPNSDVDIAVRFPDEVPPKERFERRTRLDAKLQSYAQGFVDLNDVDALPLPVARRALEEGVLIIGTLDSLNADRQEIRQQYQADRKQREQANREFIERLADDDF